MMTVTRHDWKNLSYFTNPPLNHICHIELTETAVNTLKQGYCSPDMDDHWFSYAEKNKLYIHRSWTGHLMFCATITGHSINQVDIAMDDFVKLSTEQKIEVFHHVIEFLANQPIKKHS